jgi:hypothetical protein
MLDDERRQACWREFTHAAECAAGGYYGPAKALVHAHPIIRGELTAFVKALREGRIVKEGDRFRPVKSRSPVQADPARLPRSSSRD